MLDLPQATTAVGALGTAAFGLVDATKPLTSINRTGLSHIQDAVSKFTPGATNNSLTVQQILNTVAANWTNGTDLASQKAIAKSLIHLHLNAANATQIAAQAGVDANILLSIAQKSAAAQPLSPQESDLFGRFDLIVTAVLDDAFTGADRDFRNATRLLAVIFAVILAIAGAFILQKGAPGPADIGDAVLLGLLATPIAPFAKDLSTYLATAVNALQAIRSR
jgi:hypothetical protein